MFVLTGMEIDEGGSTYMLFSPVKFDSFESAVKRLEMNIEEYCTAYLDARVERHGGENCTIWLDSFMFRHYVEFMITEV